MSGVLFMAEAGFESARQLHTLPAGHRARGLHGHGFKASVRAALPDGWASFGGGEVGQLQERLAACVAPLDHSLLNEQVEEPDDARLASWIGEQLRLPAAWCIGVQSTASMGVERMDDGQAQLWRRYRFQSAHRLPNVPLGHKCGRMHGHGFEAVLHMALGANESSALAADRLDEQWAPVHMALNYACLNELPGLENPTSEMLTRWIWQRLEPSVAGLVSVKVFETASCGALYDGATHRIWKDFHLDSALRLRRAPAGHPHARLHGHTYTLRLHLAAPLDELRGWAVDFGDVKEVFRPVFKALDHHALQDIPDLADCDAASVAGWVLSQAKSRLPQVQRVDVFEMEGCGASAGVDSSVPTA